MSIYVIPAAVEQLPKSEMRPVTWFDGSGEPSAADGCDADCGRQTQEEIWSIELDTEP